MEIKRIADHIIVDINKKRFCIYWNRNYKFGENLIQRFFERLTVSELESLDNVIKLMNKALKTREKLTEEEMQKCLDVDKMIYFKINLQALCYLAKLDLEKLQSFIEACRPLAYEFGISKLKEAYANRYAGIENAREKSIQDCTCLEDWCVTRALIAKFIATDIASSYRFFMVDNGDKIIKDVMGKPTRLKTESFFIQAFMETPVITDLDKKSYTGELQDKYRAKISEMFKARHNWEKVNKDPKQPAEFVIKRNQLSALIQNLKSMFPKKSLIEPREKICTLSNATRKSIVIDFFNYWDSHMIDDIAFMKEQDELAALINKEKHDKIDEEDIALTGKTQAQHAADQQGLVMEVKDEDGNVVKEEKIL